MTREAIALYSGPATLRSDELAIEGEAVITFAWQPKPAVHFAFGSDHAPLPAVLSPRIVKAVEPSTAEVADPFDPERSGSELGGKWNYRTSGDAPHQERGDPTGLARLRLAVINFTDGHLPRYQADAPYTDFLEVDVDPWLLRLEATAADRDWRDDLRLERGYHITHWLSVQRLDDALFAADEIEDLRSALWHVLSFTRGALVGLALPTGFGPDGSVRWCQWATTIVSPWQSRLTWFDESCFPELGPLIGNWLKRCEDDFWSDVLPRALRITLTANDTDPLDASIPAAFTGLELLAWAVLEVDRGWLRPGDGDVTAAGKLRLLLHWAGIDTELPPELETLREYLGGDPDLDIPTALAFVRNRLAHPPKKRTGRWPSPKVMLEAWRIALEMLELVILRLLEYDGNYGHRRHLQGRWIGDVDSVPWARDREAT